MKRLDFMLKHVKKQAYINKSLIQDSIGNFFKMWVLEYYYIGISH